MHTSDVNEGRKRARGVLAACAIFVAGHTLLVAHYFRPATTTPDANSYLVQARLLAEHAETSFVPATPISYVGPHFSEGADGRYYASHPPGLSALWAAAWVPFGAPGALLVNLALGALALFGLFLLGRHFLPSSAWSLVATGLVATSPIVNEHELFGDAHLAVACLLVWSLLALAEASRATSSRRRLAALFGAAVLAGSIPWVRYADGILWVGLGGYVLVILRALDSASRRRAIAAVLAGGLPLPLALLVRNHLAYGGWLTTGYAEVIGPRPFGLQYLGEHLGELLLQLTFFASFLVFPVTLAGIVHLLARRPRDGALFALLVVPPILLYAAFFTPLDPQSTRYLIPAIFAGALPAVALLAALAARWPVAGGAVAGVLLAANLAGGAGESHRRLAQLESDGRVFAKVAEELRDVAPPGTTVLTEERLSQYLDGLGEWHLLGAGVLDGLLDRHAPVPPGSAASAPSARRPRPLALGTAETAALVRRTLVARGVRVAYVVAEAADVAALATVLGSDLDPLARIDLEPPPEPLHPERPPPTKWPRIDSLRPRHPPLRAPRATDEPGRLVVVAWPLRAELEEPRAP